MDRAARGAARLDGAARRGIRRDRGGLRRRRSRRVARRVAAPIAVAGQAAALLAWRATRRDGSTPAGRIHFFADAALLSNTLFIVMILLGGITAAHLAPCRQA